MIAKIIASEVKIGKTQWLFGYSPFNFADTVDFLQKKEVNLGMDFPVDKLETVLRNWWDEVAISMSKEIILTIRFIRKNSTSVEAVSFLITGGDAMDFIEVMKRRWKKGFEKLESLDLPKSEPAKTKTEPPPEIKLPKNDSPYPYRE